MHRLWRQRRPILLAQASLLGLLSGFTLSTAFADGFTVTGSLGGSFEMDTNPLLDKKGAQTLYGWNSTPQLILTGRTPDLTLDSVNTVNDSRYNLQNFDSTDYHNFTTLYYQGERSYLKLQGGLDYDTTRTSEIGNSGNNIAGVRHTGINFAPEFGYNLTEVQQIVLAATYGASFYDDKKAYTNFQSFSVTPEYRYAFTMRDTGFVALQGTYFDTLSGSSSTGESLGPLVGWIHKFSDKFTTRADIGYHMVHNDSDAEGSNWDNDYFYDFSLTYGEQGDPDIAIISVKRALQPQSSAQQVTQTAISVQETHNFTQRFAAVVGATYNTQSYNLQEDGREKDYLEASADLQYHVTQEVVIGSSYRYRQETTIHEDGVARGHTVMLTLTYNPFAKLISW